MPLKAGLAANQVLTRSVEAFEKILARNTPMLVVVLLRNNMSKPTTRRITTTAFASIVQLPSQAKAGVQSLSGDIDSCVGAIVRTSGSSGSEYFVGVRFIIYYFRIKKCSFFSKSYLPLESLLF